MIYFVILFFLLILTVRYDINGKEEYREQWYNTVLAIFVLLAGLRFRLGEDTINYLYTFYYDTPKLWDIKTDTLLSSGQPPLWIILNSIVKTLGGRFYIVQLIQAIIVNTLVLKYFKKHSPYPFACAALFFFWRYQWYSMVVMKAAIALSIILFANDYFLEKKYKKGCLLVLLATGFHQSSLLLLIVPFICFLKFNKLGVIILVCTYFVGLFLQSKLGDVFVMLNFAEGISNKLDNYVDSGFMMQNHNLNFFIIKIFPIVLYPVISVIYLKRKCKDSHILTLEPCLMIGLLFQIMQFNIDVFYRYVYIFIIYYIIFIVQFFVEFSKNTLALQRSLSYFRTFAVVFPLVFSIAYLYPMTQVNFNPYSSVIERSIDKARENYFAGFVAYYYLNVNHY